LISTLKDDGDFLNNISDINLLSSSVNFYSDEEQRLFTLAAMERGDSEQAKAAIEQDMTPPLSFKGHLVQADETEVLSKTEATLVVTGGDIDGKVTKQLTVGYRHLFSLQPGQRAVIELLHGTLGGKTSHNFVCDDEEFRLYVDLRAAR
jgi:hypothetical protein